MYFIFGKKKIHNIFLFYSTFFFCFFLLLYIYIYNNIGFEVLEIFMYTDFYFIVDFTYIYTLTEYLTLFVSLIKIYLFSIHMYYIIFLTVVFLISYYLYLVFLYNVIFLKLYYYWGFLFCSSYYYWNTYFNSLQFSLFFNKTGEHTLYSALHSLIILIFYFFIYTQLLFKVFLIYKWDVALHYKLYNFLPIVLYSMLLGCLWTFYTDYSYIFWSWDIIEVFFMNFVLWVFLIFHLTSNVTLRDYFIFLFICNLLFFRFSILSSTHHILQTNKIVICTTLHLQITYLLKFYSSYIGLCVLLMSYYLMWDKTYFLGEIKQQIAMSYVSFILEKIYFIFYYYYVYFFFLWFMYSSFNFWCLEFFANLYVYLYFISFFLILLFIIYFNIPGCINKYLFLYYLLCNILFLYYSRTLYLFLLFFNLNFFNYQHLWIIFFFNIFLINYIYLVKFSAGLPIFLEFIKLKWPLIHSQTNFILFWDFFSFSYFGGLYFLINSILLSVYFMYFRPLTYFFILTGRIFLLKFYHVCLTIFLKN